MSTTVAGDKPANGNGHGAVATIPRHHDEEDYITRLARDPAIDPAKLQVLWDIQKDVRAQQQAERREEARLEYHVAMALAQSEFPIIGRDARNEQTKSRYARFESIWEDCCPIWTKHGLSVSFPSRKTEQGLISMVARVRHASGHVEDITCPDSPPDNVGPKGTVNKTDVQANQSTVSYIKRGLLCAAFGIVTRYEDDDGQRSPVTTQQQRPDRGLPWLDSAQQALTGLPSANAWMQRLGQLLPDAPTAVDVTKLARWAKPMADRQNAAFRADARQLFEERLKQMAEPATPSDKPPDEPSDTAPPVDPFPDPVLPPDEQWAEDTLSQLALISAMPVFMDYANQPDMQATMRRLSRENRPLFDRVKAGFASRQDRIARESVQ